MRIVKMKLPRCQHIGILLVFYVILTNVLHAQLSPYHGIVFPYDSPNRVVYSAGSLTYATADYSANIQNNPVSFSFIKKPQIFLIFNHDISRYYLTSIRVNRLFYNQEKSKTLHPKYNFYPRFISYTLPLNFAHQSIFLSASLNKIQTPEHEVWMTDHEYTDLNFHHQRDGHVWNASINIGCQLPLNVNLGITWSKWFGSWHWHDHNTSHSIIGEGKFKYNGNNFSIGLLKKFKGISISFNYHAPFTLMKTDDIFIKWRSNEEKYNLQQKFDGAFKLGIAYQLNDKLTLSLGCRYQNKFSMKKTMKRNFLNDKQKDEYGSSQQIALACEYIMYCNGKKLPIFLAYWANWLPKTNSQPFQFQYGYQIYTTNDHSKLNNNIIIGICYPLYLLNIHFSSQLNICSIHAYNQLVPPWSCAGLTSSNFDAKKMSVIFNLGVSYAFKSGE